MRVDDDGVLANSTDVTKNLVDKFNISMESNGCDASWINGNNERHNIRNSEIIRAELLDRNKHIKRGCATDTQEKVYLYTLHSALDNTSNQFARYGKTPASMNSKPLYVIYTP